MIMKILVASHGDLAPGIISSYRMLAGENRDILVLSLKDNDTGQFKEELSEIINTNDQILVLCDIKGGTPFNESYRLYLQNPEKIRIVSGLNLGMLLEVGLAISGGNVDLDNLADIAKESAVQSVFIAGSEDDEEEDLEF